MTNSSKIGSLHLRLCSKTVIQFDLFFRSGRSNSRINLRVLVTLGFLPFSYFLSAKSMVDKAVLKNEANHGKIIAGVGISGSGKSSTFLALHKLVGGYVFVEPEENELPSFLKKLEFCDKFTILMAFRSLRVPNLIEADKLRKGGQLVFIDSCFDKIMYHYVGKKEFDWLINSKDPYLPALKLIKDLDKDTLPNPDVIILFEIDYETWIKFLKKRNRKTDSDVEFLKNYKNYKTIEGAVFDIAKRKNIKVVRFKQTYSSPEEQAQKLQRILIQNELI